MNTKPKLVLPLFVLLAFTLAACGLNPGSSSLPRRSTRLQI
jgi:predicted small lipoprotein YifL